MKRLPSVTATVLALLLVGAGVGSVTAIDTSATDALTAQQLTDSRADQVDTASDQPRRLVRHDARTAGIRGADWLDDLDDVLTVFDLTEAERAAIVDEAAAMRADDATAADVHHMVHYHLYTKGYDTRDVHAHVVAYRLGAAFDLTDEQVAELAAGIVDKLDSGADRAEIREYVRETLSDFGVTDEELRAARVEYRLRALAERHDLTDAQTDELVEGALDLVDDGADRTEIREYVRETLSDFGVEFDQRPRSPRGDDRRDRPGSPRNTDTDR